MPVCELDGIVYSGNGTYNGVEVQNLMESKSITATTLRRHQSCSHVFTYSVRWGEGPFKYANGQGWDEEWSGIKEASYAWRFCA